MVFTFLLFPSRILLFFSSIIKNLAILISSCGVIVRLTSKQIIFVKEVTLMLVFFIFSQDLAGEIYNLSQQIDMFHLYLLPTSIQTMHLFFSTWVLYVLGEEFNYLFNFFSSSSMKSTKVENLL